MVVWFPLHPALKDLARCRHISQHLLHVDVFVPELVHAGQQSDCTVPHIACMVDKPAKRVRAESLTLIAALSSASSKVTEQTLYRTSGCVNEGSSPMLPRVERAMQGLSDVQAWKLTPQYNDQQMKTRWVACVTGTAAASQAVALEAASRRQQQLTGAASPFQHTLATGGRWCS